MSQLMSRPRPAPPPVGRTLGWPTWRRTEPGAPAWIRRGTMRVDMLLVQRDGSVERVARTVNVDE